MGSGLAPFHPLIRDWFSGKKGSPTDVQEKAWPPISQGGHVLVTAPTGSGKTLTAFLWALNQLATGAWSPGRVRVLYISPLKALNRDIRQNLIAPLAEIRAVFEAAGHPFPEIRVLTRSGDTPQNDRRKMVRHPPEILITTPESLNLLISSQTGCSILGSLKTVILDEIHACAGNKRGVHLISGVDRLVRLSGEFQRIGLSATLENPEAVARMMGGYELTGDALDPGYRPRPVTRVASDIQKDYQLKICFPRRPDQISDPDEADPGGDVWDLLAAGFMEQIEQNRSTLIFANGRRLCEKLAYKVNRAAGRIIAYAHHGSLSRELRTHVEERLRSGRLKAIVATSSLEMGIDIGDLDEVIMVQSPFSVSSAIQRLGRAGHGVGMTSSGRLFAAHAQDLIPCAVLARAVAAGDMEPLAPVDAPLDVLAQVLISMTAMETWNLDELFAFIRTCAPFHDLDRPRFDLVVNMLAGYYDKARIRELMPRVSIDRLDNTISAKKGALLALYMSGGTIPDRGYYKLRHAQTRARIGELDEEYVWEAKKGQIATLGSQNWQITRITHEDVFALPAGHRGVDAPFWIAEDVNRDFHFSLRMGRFLEAAQKALSRGKAGAADFCGTLVRDHAMDEDAAEALIRFCRSQQRIGPLPHRGHILFEYVKSGPGAGPGTMLVIHTLWGGRVNRPFALALTDAWINAFGEKPEVFPGNDAVIIQLPGPVAPQTLLSLMTPVHLEARVKNQLESSGFFAARFRECAGRALLITRKRMNRRMPLWMTRLHAQKLLENTLGYPDFPILLETWRTCIRDEFDMASLYQVLDELEQGKIAWSAVHTAVPSPFAAAMAWNQINQYMYREDQPASARSGLTDELIQGVLAGNYPRPAISRQVADEFQARRQRLVQGYAPATPGDLLDWVKERVAIAGEEWDRLLAYPEVSADGIREKLVLIHPLLKEKGGAPLVAAREKAGQILDAWYGPGTPVFVTDVDGREIRDLTDPDPDAEEMGPGLFSLWLSFYGPVSMDVCQRTLGLDRTVLDRYIAGLAETRELVSGLLIKGEDSERICDAKNYETLIRMERAASRPGVQPLAPGLLALFLARHQGLAQGLARGLAQTAGTGPDPRDRILDCLGQLACLALPAGLWEKEVLPAREPSFHPSFLDSILQEGEVIWLGREKERILFCFAPDLDLLAPVQDPAEGDILGTLFPSPATRLDYLSLKLAAGISDSGLWEMVWEGVWQGRLSATSFFALRQGIETGFCLPGPKSEPGRVRGLAGGIRGTGSFGFRGRRRRLSARSGPGRQPNALAGIWFRPGGEAPEDQGDLVDREALNRDRARLLLDRYGILFKGLISREEPGFRWGDLFKALYLMELSGEVTAGSFFKGIEGPQFMSPGTVARLKTISGKGLDKNKEEIYWMSAMDPASVCGLGGLSREMEKGFDQGPGLPKRLPGNHLVFQGPELKLVSRRNARELTIHGELEQDCLARYFAPLSHMLTRPFAPMNRIVIETINGERAPKSPFKKMLEELFEVDAGPRTLDLFQRRTHEPG